MKIHFAIILLSILNLFLINPIHAQQGMWTWMKGNPSVSTPVFGTKGVPSPLNQPPGTYEGAMWQDLQGNFWVFSGDGGGYADMWRLNTSTLEWTWMQGPGTTMVSPVYGTMGVSSPSNTPGSRHFCLASWTDNTGNLWLFGGESFFGIGKLADLWKYDISTNEWTWMKGPNTGNMAGVYGTQGVANPNNYPPSRDETAAQWTDANNNLWLFGGLGIAQLDLNDLWKYDPSTNNWTWMKGSNVGNQSGIYGTKGMADSLNTPGGRAVYGHWNDQQGNFWIFGGFTSGGYGNFNDMWKYDLASNNWTWMSGTNLFNGIGNYQNQCEPDTIKVPTSRHENRACWIDGLGNFWNFGGYDVTNGFFGDLWRYSPACGEWTWVNGDSGAYQPAVFGTMGIPSATNTPGGLFGSFGFTDSSDNLWLFGGWNTQNVLWKFTPDPMCFATGLCSILSTTSTCIGDSTYFSIGGTSLLAGVSWDFGDPGSGANNFSSAFNPVHYYAAAGTYSVQVIRFLLSGSVDTIYTQVTVNAPPVFSLGSDSTICDGTSLLLNPGSGFTSYLWNDGSTNATLSVADSGLYFVTVFNGACSATDTINVLTVICSQPIIAVAASDTSFCEKQCINFFDLSTNSPTSWQWYFPGASPDTSTLQNPTGICYNNYGSFDVKLIGCNSNGCDSIIIANFISEYQNPVDSIYASNDTLWSLTYPSYQWFEVTNGLIAGETNQYFVPSQLGSYYCVVSDSIGCVATSNTITLTGLSSPIVPNEGIQIVPNPNDGSFTLEVLPNFHMVNFQIQIVNVLGEIIFERNIENLKAIFSEKIDLNKQAKGVYFIRLNNGIGIRSLKLIIK